MKVLGVEMYDQGMLKAIAEFKDLCKVGPRNLLVSPSDANVLVHARTNPGFKKILSEFFWNLPDGMPSAWILRMKGAKNATRCSGPDFFKRIIVETKDQPVRHFLCGGKTDTVEALAQACQSWGNPHVVGTYSPPFRDLTEADYMEMADRINASEANVVWVGLGAPKQIYFAHRMAQYTKVHFLVTVGAAFDFHTGKVKKAPLWVQKIGMEWFFRLSMEPRRLTRRYLNAIPKFIWYNLRDGFLRQ